MRVKKEVDVVDTQLTKVFSDDRGNTIWTADGKLPTGSIEFTRTARDSVVKIGRSTSFSGYISVRNANSRVVIGDNCNIVSCAITIGRDCVIRIGDHVYIGANSEISSAEGTKVRIGKDSLIGAMCSIRSDDSHPFYDRVSGERINVSRDVILRSESWLARGVTVLPGATVGKGALVGAQSVVTPSRSVPAHSVAVGNPARVIRQDIQWLNRHLQSDSDIPEFIVPDGDPLEVDHTAVKENLRKKPTSAMRLRRWVKSFVSTYQGR